jgi:hypothetical protein
VTENAGPLLFRAGLITSEQLRAAYEALARIEGGSDRRAPGRTLVEQLVASGVIDEDRLCRFFHERLLVPIVGAAELARPSRRALKLLPREMAQQFRCVPLEIDEHKNLAVAMADPSDTHAVDEIQFLTGMTVFRVAAPASAVAWAIQDLYGATTTLADAPPLEAPRRKLPPAEIVEDRYGEETPIPMPVPFDQTTGRIVLIDPRSLAESLSSLDRGPEPSAHPVTEAALREAVLALEVAGDRDAIAGALVAYMRRLCRRAAVFVVRRGELAGFAGGGIGVRADSLREAVLGLDRPSTFRDIVQTRLPFRGPVGDAASRDFLIDGLGWAPADMLALPVGVRDRVVALLYGDDPGQPIPDEHLATLARAAGLAFERALILRKQP